MSYHDHEKYLFRKRLSDGKKYYINVKVMGGDTTTVAERGSYREAQEALGTAKQEHPDDIVWVADKAARNWNTQLGEARQ